MTEFNRCAEGWKLYDKWTEKIGVKGGGAGKAHQEYLKHVKECDKCQDYRAESKGEINDGDKN